MTMQTAVDSKELIAVGMTVKHDDMLTRFPAEEFNILNSAFWFQPNNADQYDMRVIVTSINPNSQSGDVYPQNRQLALNKNAIDRLMDAAGVKVNVKLTGRVDDGSDPEYWRYRFVASVLTPTGERVEKVAEKEIRVSTLERLYRMEQFRQGKRDTELENAVKNRLADTLPHAAALCETKARLRWGRAALGIKATYTTAELSKPFVVFQVVPKPGSDNHKVYGVLAELVEGIVREQNALTARVLEDDLDEKAKKSTRQDLIAVSAKLDVLPELRQRLTDEVGHYANGKSRDVLYGDEDFEGFDPPPNKPQNSKKAEPRKVRSKTKAQFVCKNPDCDNEIAIKGTVCPDCADKRTEKKIAERDGQKATAKKKPPAKKADKQPAPKLEKLTALDYAQRAEEWGFLRSQYEWIRDEYMREVDKKLTDLTTNDYIDLVKRLEDRFLAKTRLQEFAQENGITSAKVAKAIKDRMKARPDCPVLSEVEFIGIQDVFVKELQTADADKALAKKKKKAASKAGSNGN